MEPILALVLQSLASSAIRLGEVLKGSSDETSGNTTISNDESNNAIPPTIGLLPNLVAKFVTAFAILSEKSQTMKRPKLTPDQIDSIMRAVDEEPDKSLGLDDEDWSVDKGLWSLTIDLVNEKVPFPVMLALAYALLLIRVKALHHRCNEQPESNESVVWTYLEYAESHLDDASLSKRNPKRRRASIKTKEKTELNALVASISLLYARLLAGDSIVSILSELIEDAESNHHSSLETPCTEFSYTLNEDLMASLYQGRPLHYQKECLPNSSRLLEKNLDLDSIELVVAAEVQRAVGIDLHTHLLPPTHGPLCLWGIDELLTYVSSRNH